MKFLKLFQRQKITRSASALETSLSRYMDQLDYQKSPNLSKNECLRLYNEGILGDLIEEVTAPIRSIENFHITGHENAEIIKYLQDYGKNKLAILLAELATDCHLFGLAAVFFPAINDRKFSKFQYHRLPAYNIDEKNIDNKIEYKYTDTAGRQFSFVHKYGRKYYSQGMMGFLLVIRGYKANNSTWITVPPNRIKNELRYLDELGLKNIRQMQGVSLDYVANIPHGDALDPHQLKAFKENFLNRHQGANGERVIFAIGEGKITPISQTNREAEYLLTAQEFLKRCYNWAKIPLALKTTEASTYNNFNVAKYSLIMDAVFPTLSLILQNIHEFFLHFWPHEKGKLWFNESDIPVMKDKREEEIMTLFKNAIISEEEAREMLGLQG